MRSELERLVLFTLPAHAQLRVTIHSKMHLRHKILLTFAILWETIEGDILARESSIANASDSFYYKGMEVPDSPLLLFERMHLRRLLSTGRGKQSVSTNSTSVTSPSSTTPAPSDSRCQCSLGVCKCCTGLVMDLFSQKACMKITYHPGDFAFDVAMSLNDRILYENSMSGKSPRPICISPPRLNNLKMCAKFYNVFFPGRNFHFCLAMNGQWRSLELFNIAFDCLRMGANGIAMLKPDDAGGLVIPNPQGGVDAVIDEGDDIEDYDENVVKSLLDIFDR